MPETLVISSYHTLHGSFVWFNSAAPWPTFQLLLPVGSKQCSCIFNSCELTDGVRITGTIWPPIANLPPGLRLAYLKDIQTWTHTFNYLQIPSKLALAIWPKRCCSNAGRRDLWEVRLLWICPSRGGNKRCQSKKDRKHQAWLCFTWTALIKSI